MTEAAQYERRIPERRLALDLALVVIDVIGLTRRGDRLAVGRHAEEDRAVDSRPVPADQALVAVPDVLVDPEVVDPDPIAGVGVRVRSEHAMEIVLVGDRLVEHQVLEQAVVGVELADGLGAVPESLQPHNGEAVIHSSLPCGAVAVCGSSRPGPAEGRSRGHRQHRSQRLTRRLHPWGGNQVLDGSTPPCDL